jgi:hypothetical protein
MQDYDISYEFGSLQDILIRGVKYALKDKRRLLRGLLYAVYLWIFFRRFLHMIQSSIKFLSKLVLNFVYKMKLKKPSSPPAIGPMPRQAKS